MKKPPDRNLTSLPPFTFNHHSDSCSSTWYTASRLTHNNLSNTLLVTSDRIFFLNSVYVKDFGSWALLHTSHLRKLETAMLLIWLHWEASRKALQHSHMEVITYITFHFYLSSPPKLPPPSSYDFPASLFPLLFISHCLCLALLHIHHAQVPDVWQSLCRRRHQEWIRQMDTHMLLQRNVLIDSYLSWLFSLDWTVLDIKNS